MKGFISVNFILQECKICNKLCSFNEGHGERKQSLNFNKGSTTFWKYYCDHVNSDNVFCVGNTWMIIERNV